MLNLEIIRDKLNKLFNGIEVEGNTISPINEHYFFNVASQGYELKHIYDMKSGKNFIPVFISSMGGEINPIPNLKEVDLNIEVLVYFPVRFKNDFYITFTDFLLETFVGKIISFSGEEALCNISVPQYSEIDTFAVKQFQNFVENIYKRPIEINEQWMSMSFNLYLSTYNKLNQEGGIVLGNSANISLSFVDDEGEIRIDNNPIFVDTSFSSSSSVGAEQILGQQETKGFPQTTSYASGVAIYVKKDDFYRKLLQQIADGGVQGTYINYTINVEGLVSFTRQCYLNESSVNFSKGSPITISFNFGVLK